jgi:hypothetical protein
MAGYDEETEYMIPIESTYLKNSEFKKLQQLINDINVFLSILENAPILELHFDGRWFLVVRTWN